MTLLDVALVVVALAGLVQLVRCLASLRGDEMTNTHENEQIKKLLMVCSHLQTEGQDIDLNNTIVEEYRYKGGWHVPAIPTRAYTMTREFIRRLDR